MPTSPIEHLYSGNCLIVDGAVIKDRAVVGGNAQIGGDSVVEGNDRYSGDEGNVGARYQGGEDQRSSSPSSSWACCDACGRGPAIEMRIRRSAGIVYMKMYTSGKVNLCKECGLSALRYSQVRSLATAVINPLTAPYALGQNARWASPTEEPPRPTR